MIVSFANETVEVLRPAQVVEWGQTVVDWEDLTSHTVDGCTGYALAGMETVQGVDVTSGTFQLFMPPDADIEATDRVRFRGKLWEVQGEPSLQKSPLGSVNHIDVIIRYWDGKK